MTTEERVRELHDKAVREPVDAHKKRTDEPLILAVRYGLDAPQDVYLLEVLKDFPGGDDDEVLVTGFEPSPQLRILGRLHLALGSPAQIRSAAIRQDAIIDQAKNGVLLFDDGSPDAQALKRLLEL